jgi:hypothetical protein
LDIIGLHRYSDLKNQDFAASKKVPGKFITSFPHEILLQHGEKGLL